METERSLWSQQYPTEIEELEAEASPESCAKAWRLLSILRSRGHDMSKLHFFSYEGGVMVEWHDKGLYCEVVGESGEFEVEKAERPDERGLVKFKMTCHTSEEEAVDQILEHLQ